MNASFEMALEKYVKHLKMIERDPDKLFRVHETQNFFKITSYFMSEKIGLFGESVVAFVAKKNIANKTLGIVNEGDILKPASWKVPAKGSRGSIFDSGLPRSLYRAASSKKVRLKQAFRQMTPRQKKAFIGKIKKWIGEKFDEFMANNALDEMRSIKAGELDLFMEYKQKFENFGQELETFMKQNKQQGRAREDTHKRTNKRRAGIRMRAKRHFEPL